MERRIVYSVLAIFFRSSTTGKQTFVLQGETVTLPCNIAWDMPPRWRGPGNVTTYTSGYEINPQLENFHRITLITNKTLGTFDLVIQQFSLEDEGVYVCSSVMSGGIIKDENISVNIKNAPDISFHFSKSEEFLRCLPHGVPGNYTFYKWEHKSEFDEHIRYIPDGRNGHIHISSDLNETHHHQDRGIYVCRVSNGVSTNGKSVQSSEYLITPEGKPYFTTANSAEQYSLLDRIAKIDIYVVSFPNISNILIYKPNFSVEEIDYQKLDLTRIQDTMYGKNVFVRGYIISFTVSIHSDNQSYTVEVYNSIGSNNYTVYLILTERNTTHTAVYIIPILLVGLAIILLAMIYYRLQSGNNIDRQSVSFDRRLQQPSCDDEAGSDISEKSDDNSEYKTAPGKGDKPFNYIDICIDNEPRDSSTACMFHGTDNIEMNVAKTLGKTSSSDEDGECD